MFVYAMRGGGYVKIGVSDDIQKRLKTFNGGALPFTMSVICLAQATTEDAIKIEYDMLSWLPGRMNGEWIDGAIDDGEIIAAFKAVCRWTGPVLEHPTNEQIASQNMQTRLQKILAASRAVTEAMEASKTANLGFPQGADWHKIATEAQNSGEVTQLRKIKRAFKAKRLAAQNKAGMRRA